ncbi:MAG: hypothetical protein HY796_06650 [Elusimicrobia bacterium]|nr:hypothetical protein [Elusimicrobiota bacterium]
MVRSWKPLADNFYFTPEEDQKYQLLENKRFVLYFASSDGYEYTPRKFKEPVLPLSEF